MPSGVYPRKPKEETTPDDVAQGTAPTVLEAAVKRKAGRPPGSGKKKTEAPKVKVDLSKTAMGEGIGVFGLAPIFLADMLSTPIARKFVGAENFRLANYLNPSHLDEVRRNFTLALGGSPEIELSPWGLYGVSVVGTVVAAVTAAIVSAGGPEAQASMEAVQKAASGPTLVPPEPETPAPVVELRPEVKNGAAPYAGGDVSGSPGPLSGQAVPEQPSGGGGASA